MKKRWMPLALPLALLGGLLVAVGDAGAADTIRMRGKKPVRGDIKSMTKDKIQIDERGVATEVATSDVDLVIFEGEPDELSEARTSIRGGGFIDAIERLKLIDRDTINRRAIKSDIDFYNAFAVAQLALGGSGTLDDAKKLMGKFIQNNKDSYHYYPATEIYGDIAVGLGDFVRAERSYTVAAKAPGAESKMRVGLARARLYQAQGKYAEAIAAYEKVLSTGQQGPAAVRHRLTATLGKASSLARAKQGAEGLKLVDSVIKSAEKGDTEVHARAYLALGDCQMAMDDPKAAVLAYLHVDALYYQHPALHAEALAKTASLWDQMDKPARAAKARKTLRSRYPNSKWSKS